MKRIFILIFALFLTTVTYSQSVSFGPRVGMNIAKLRGIEDSKLGLNVGGFVNAYVTQKWGVEVAAMFSQEGGTESSSSSGYNYDISTKLNYLNIPVLLKYKLFGNFNVFAGPQFGKLLSATLDKGSSYNIKDCLSKTTVSGVAGVGCTFLKLLDVNVNYNFGVQNIVIDQSVIEGIETINSSLKNGTWQLTVGISF
ncbi:MAG: porin family protein [Rikenellaceae bacterium]